MNALISSPDGGGSLMAGGVLFGYRQCRHQSDHALGRKRSSHQTGRRAALEKRGQPCSRTERCEAVEECLREKATQIGTERSNGPALDHVQAPKRSKATPPSSRGERAYPSGLHRRQYRRPLEKRKAKIAPRALHSGCAARGACPSTQENGLGRPQEGQNRSAELAPPAFHGRPVRPCPLLIQAVHGRREASETDGGH